MDDSEARNQTPEAVVARPARRRKGGWPRILLWSAGGLLALLLAGAGVGLLWLRAATVAALPLLDGDVHLAGLSAPVTVRRDGHGVPHIEAASEIDLFTAQGYVTAQDRLWQMDAYRRNANGELAEVLGPSMVAHDRAQRVLQFRNTARRVYANLSAEDRARFEAYARGVNLFIAQHADSLPAEFGLLHYKPQPWSGVDSVSIGLTMAETLDTLSKIARALDLPITQFFADDSLGKQANLQKLSDEELRFLTQIRRYSTNLNDSDRKLLLAMVKKFAATATR